MPKDPDIVVLGAGVIGLTSALRLCDELPTANVTVIAETFENETTSAGAAGLWEPYKLSDTPPELIRRWGKETFEHLQVLLPIRLAKVLLYGLHEKCRNIYSDLAILLFSEALCMRE